MIKKLRFILFIPITMLYFTSVIGSVSDTYGITLTGIGNLKVEIPKGNGNVLYTIRITNIGTELDTISLTTEGTVKTSLTRNSVTLAPGASTDVVMVISEEELSDVGTYEVNVTATSKGDPTKTATITTTTIIFTCGVEVDSIGDVKIETTESGTSASYKIHITNIGSRSDTVSLSVSGGVDVELSETSVVLEAGTSAEVILTIDEDVFAGLLSTPGEYKVVITATSSSISTETDEITTTIIVEQIPADLTADGVVNILDLVKVANAFGSEGNGLAADITMDGIVNILDLVKVASHFGETQIDYALANFSISHK